MMAETSRYDGCSCQYILNFFYPRCDPDMPCRYIFPLPPVVPEYAGAGPQQQIQKKIRIPDCPADCFLICRIENDAVITMINHEYPARYLGSWGH